MASSNVFFQHYTQSEVFFHRTQNPSLPSLNIRQISGRVSPAVRICSLNVDRFPHYRRSHLKSLQSFRQLLLLPSGFGDSYNVRNHSALLRASPSPQPEGEPSKEQDVKLADHDSSKEIQTDQTLEPEQPLEASEGLSNIASWQRPWPVPWGFTETAVGMFAWIVSFIGSGLVVQLLAYKAGWTPWRSPDLDDQALFLLLNQAVRTALGVFIVWRVAQPYRPLNSELYSFELGKPFNLERGWLLWAGIGFISACILVQLSSLAQASFDGHEPVRDDADALSQVLPMIAASPLSTGSLICVAGIFAPLLEETIFRGFLMTSLTKWMPVPVAALLSAAAFAGAHLTPNEFPKLATLGFVLGMTYAKTRNLLAPMVIHSLWNSGIIILLTLLRLEGYDLENLI